MLVQSGDRQPDTARDTYCTIIARPGTPLSRTDWLSLPRSTLPARLSRPIRWPRPPKRRVEGQRACLEPSRLMTELISLSSNKKISIVPYYLASNFCLL